MERKKNLKIIFMGSSSFSEIILRGLMREKYDIISAYTRPDKKVGRKKTLEKTPVKFLAEEKNIKIFTPEKFDHAEVEKLKEQKPDLIIVAAYGIILPAAVLAVPKYKSLNIHPSLLPNLRGPSPIQTALLQGYQQTGSTIMLMNEKMDEGDILFQKKFPIGAKENFSELSLKMADFSLELLLKTIPDWISRKIIPQKQKPEKASYSKIIKKEDGRVDWKKPAEEIFNQWRAFYPWPGIFSLWQKNKDLRRIKLVEVDFLRDEESGINPGEVFLWKEKVAIKAGKGALFVKKIQLEGKAPSLAKDFLNGQSKFLGSVLK